MGKREKRVDAKVDVEGMASDRIIFDIDGFQSSEISSLRVSEGGCLGNTKFTVTDLQL
jgi:hypothetical protein